MTPYKGSWAASPKFDASGSAVVTFFGQPAHVTVHWQPIGVPLGRLVCPRTIDVAKSECWLCKKKDSNQAVPPTNDGPRILSMIYDWGQERFGTFVMTTPVMLEIVGALKVAGYDAQSIESGNGPSFGLQRTQDKRTLVAVLAIKQIPKELPSMEEMLARTEQESAYAQDESKFIMSKPDGQRLSWGKDNPQDRWTFI